MNSTMAPEGPKEIAEKGRDDKVSEPPKFSQGILEP